MGDPTLEDVARLAEVHKGTASRALDPSRSALVNEATRLRVIDAATRLDYRGNALARGLRKGRSGVIGVVVADIGNPFLPTVLRGIEQETEPVGLMLLIMETRDRVDRLAQTLELLSARQVDGIILCAAHLSNTPLVRRLAGVMPLVLAIRTLPGIDVHSVVHDDQLGGRLAATHLAEMGHTRIAQLCGPPDVSSFIGRSAGYRQVIRDHPALQDLSGPERAAEPTAAEGRRLMAHLLSGLPRRRWPTGVFAHNDMMAVGALEAMADHGMSCPQDISLVGYNDSPLTAHLSPSLTTVRLPSEEVGREAARILLAQIDGTVGGTATSALEPTLVIRSSTRRRRRTPARAPAQPDPAGTAP